MFVIMMATCCIFVVLDPAAAESYIYFNQFNKKIRKLLSEKQ